MLAERTFTEADQVRFAAVSGDRNPMHLDAVLARRTQAGVPVVHGVHLLLWGLDALARAEPALPPMRRLKAHFKHFAAVDERVAVTATRTEASVHPPFRRGRNDDRPTRGRVRRGRPGGGSAFGRTCSRSRRSARSVVRRDGRECQGGWPLRARPMRSPRCSRRPPSWLGPRRVAALAATTLLVGMVCPGLHSIYGGLTVEACDESVLEDRLSFRVVGD